MFSSESETTGSRGASSPACATDPSAARLAAASPHDSTRSVRSHERAASRASSQSSRRIRSNVSLVPSARTDTSVPPSNGGGAPVLHAGSPPSRSPSLAPALSRSGRGSAYTSLRHRPPPLPPINENLDRGHRPATDAVALSSQNVSLAAIVLPRGSSTSTPPSPPPKSRQNSASDPPGVDARAPGSRIHMSRVLPSPSTGAEPPSGEIHTVAGSIPRGATTPATPSAGRVLEPPSLCAFAMAAKFRYKRSPNREHTLSGWNCTP